MQYSIFHIPIEEIENITKSWKLQTHKSTCEQIESQQNTLSIQQDKAADSLLHL